MFNKVFGEIEYEYGWNGSVEMDCFGKKQSVDLVISGEMESEFEQWQYDSFKSFMNSWKTIQEEVKIGIYEYYFQLRTELGFDDNSNTDFPDLNDADDIIGMIHIDALVIPEVGMYEERCVNLALSCSWDEENGVGIRFINEKVNEIGYQDIAF